MGKRGGISRGEMGEGGGASSRSEEFGFGKVQTNAVGFTEFLEAGDIENEIAEGDDRSDIVKEGHGGGTGARVVIAWGGETAEVST